MELREYPLTTIDGDSKLTTGAGCVIVMQGRVLLVRSTGSDLFKFPGGHVNDTETLRAAALRELKEETSLAAELTGDPFVYLLSPADDHDILLYHYPARIVSGNPTPGTEIEEIIWADVKDLPRKLYDNVEPTLEKLLLQPV